MKHRMNKMKWMVVLMVLGAAFNASAVLIAAESFQTSGEIDDYTAELHVTHEANHKIVAGNYGFNEDEPWVNITGAVMCNGTPEITDHSAITTFPGRTSELGSLRIKPQKNINRNSRRNLAITSLPLSSTYFLSGLIRLGELSHLRDGQDLSMGFKYTIADVEQYKIDDGMHFGVRRHDGAAYLTASAGGNTYDLFDLTSHDAEVFQIVIRLDVNAAGNDTLTAWYAANGATELTLGLTSTSVETWDSAQDLKMLVAQQKSTYDYDPFGSRFDEVRLGTEFADVTTLPEPGLPGGYEAWIGNYPSAGILTNRTDNPDDDSLNNLYEWGLGGDPTNGTDIGHVPTYGMVESGGTNVLEYVYAKRNNADLLGLTYHLEQNTSLIVGTWTNDNYSVEGTGALDGKFNSVTNTLPIDIEDIQFLRLIIQDN